MTGMSGIWPRLGARVADLLFPRSCVHCGGIVEDTPLEHLCRRCERELILAEAPACHTCGHPFFGVVTGARSCPHCADLDPVFERGMTLFLMRGPGRLLLHELKYRGGRYVLRDFRRLIEARTAYRAHIADAVMVPVPLHPVKLRERGFNQSLLIARMLAACAGGTTRVAELLIRPEYTGSQTRLTRQARYRNVKNAFAIAPNKAIDGGLKYVLVDDVFTTGATLNACCRVLRDAGATRLNVATIGHG